MELTAILSSIGTLALGVISYFLKRTISKTDDHDKDIQDIKRTYVTKDELKDFKSEFKESLNKISDDVEGIKENCLSKRDFYRVQAKSDEKIDKMYDLLLKMNGGSSRGN